MERLLNVPKLVYMPTFDVCNIISFEEEKCNTRELTLLLYMIYIKHRKIY